MQELKASFLDETTQMSGGGGDQKLDINDETYVKTIAKIRPPPLVF